MLDLFNNEVTSQESYRDSVFELLPNLIYLDGFDRDDMEAPDDEEDGEDDDEDGEDGSNEDGEGDDDEDDDLGESKITDYKYKV